MPVVSFRLSDDDAERLHHLGVEPGLRARDLLLQELREEEIRAGLERLARRSRHPERSTAELVRKLREGR